MCAGRNQHSFSYDLIYFLTSAISCAHGYDCVVPPIFKQEKANVTQSQLLNTPLSKLRGHQCPPSSLCPSLSVRRSDLRQKSPLLLTSCLLIPRVTQTCTVRPLLLSGHLLLFPCSSVKPNVSRSGNHILGACPRFDK